MGVYTIFRNSHIVDWDPSAHSGQPDQCKVLLLYSLRNAARNEGGAGCALAEGEDLAKKTWGTGNGSTRNVSGMLIHPAKMRPIMPIKQEMGSSTNVCGLDFSIVVGAPYPNLWRLLNVITKVIPMNGQFYHVNIHL